MTSTIECIPASNDEEVLCYPVEDVRPKVPAPRDYSALPLLTRKGAKSFAPKLQSPPGLISCLVAGLHQYVGSRTQVGTSALRNSLVQLFSQENHQVAAVIRVTDAGLRQAIKAVIDTGAGPSFIRKSEVPKSYKIMPLLVDLPRVVGASGECISLLGVVEIDIQLCAHKTKDLMIVTKNLPVSMLLGTGYHDRYVSVISPNYRYS